MSKTSEMAQRRALARTIDDPDYRRRKEELLQAAAAVFKRKGYSATTLHDIASEVGIDRASLYYYVSGKEQLYHEVVFEAVRDNVLAIENIMAENISAVEKMYKFIRTIMRSYEVHYPYLYLYVQEDMAVINDDTEWATEMREFGRRINKAVIAMVQQGLDDRVFRSTHGDARLVAFGIIGMCNWTHRWFRPGGKETAEQVSAAFSELILSGLTR